MFKVIDDLSPPSLREHVTRVAKKYKSKFVDFAKKRNLPYEEWEEYSITLHLLEHDLDIDKIVNKTMRVLAYQLNDISKNHLRYKHKKSKRIQINYKGTNEWRTLTKLALDIQRTKKKGK